MKKSISDLYSDFKDFTKTATSEIYLDIIKWVVIIISAGVVFYIVCPKYEFRESGRMRLNKITGVIDIRSERKWLSLNQFQESQKQKLQKQKKQAKTEKIPAQGQQFGNFTLLPQETAK